MALRYAVEGGHGEVVHLLITAGADTHAVYEVGMYVVHAWTTVT
jgi:hypothetical protein